MLREPVARIVRGVVFSLFLVLVPVAQSVEPGQTQETSEELSPIFDRANSVWGYADNTGKIVIKPQFSSAKRFSEGLALVWAGGVHLDDPVTKAFVKMGYIDTKGRWVISSRFEYYFFDDFSEGFVPFRKQSAKWGYMDKTGKVVIHPRFDWAGNFSKGIAPVILDGKCAHIDKTGTVTDQSQEILERHSRFEPDNRGTYHRNPHPSLCS
jgi:hypothetical protein